MEKRTKIDPEATSIPNDVIFTFVFPKLPAKTLVRFRSVSKLWLSQLRDPQLGELHWSSSGTRTPLETSIVVAFTEHLASKQSLLFSNISGRINPSSPLHTTAYKYVSQVVNGSVCMINPDRVSVFNLSTRDIIDLPESSSKPKETPSETHHSRFLFGVDSSSHYYKVVRVNTTITKKNGSNSNKCEIFTLGTKSWRRIKPGPCKFSRLSKDPAVHTLCHIQSVCMNGVIHWIQNPKTSGKRRISMFDVGNERFVRGVDFPPRVPRTVKYPIEIGGKLALVDYKSDHNNDNLSIWVLEDHGKPMWSYKKVWAPRTSRCLHCFPVGSSFSDKIFVVIGGTSLTFTLLCFDLNEPKDQPRRITLSGMTSDLYKVWFQPRLDSLALFITDKLDNMLPMKAIV